jgi:hypothetical protein
MSNLFEFISIEYSFREINFRGVQLLGVAQEHNFHRPVSRPLAVQCLYGRSTNYVEYNINSFDHTHLTI